MAATLNHTQPHFTMARTISEYLFQNRGQLQTGKAKYPWDEWTNGEIWEITRGVDYNPEPRRMRMRLYNRAQRYGLKVQVNVIGDRIIFVFSAPSTTPQEEVMKVKQPTTPKKKRSTRQVKPPHERITWLMVRRIEADLTVEEMAQAVDMLPNSYRALEQKVEMSVSLRTARALADILDCTLDDLISDDDKRSPMEVLFQYIRAQRDERS